MKRPLILFGAALLVISNGDLALAQTTGAGQPPSGAANGTATKDTTPTKAQGLKQGANDYAATGWMMGPGMMGMCPGATGSQGAATAPPGAGMMGCGMAGTCPGGMWGPASKVRVEKHPTGASIIITAVDPQVVTRLQGAAANGGGCMIGGQGHMMGPGHMGQGMMGQGMMGQGMMGGQGTVGAAPGTCAGMMGPGTTAQVTKVAKGLSINITGADQKAINRVQKMAEAMRLMHEASQL